MQVYRPNVVAELLPILQDAQAAQARQNADRMATDFPGMPHGGMDERRRAFDAIIIDGLRNPHHVRCPPPADASASVLVVFTLLQFSSS